jgi:hypothetical protein
MQRFRSSPSRHPAGHPAARSGFAATGHLRVEHAVGPARRAVVSETIRLPISHGRALLRRGPVSTVEATGQSSRYAGEDGSSRPTPEQVAAIVAGIVGRRQRARSCRIRAAATRWAAPTVSVLRALDDWLGAQPAAGSVGYDSMPPKRSDGVHRPMRDDERDDGDAAADPPSKRGADPRQSTSHIRSATPLSGDDMPALWHRNRPASRSAQLRPASDGPGRRPPSNDRVPAEGRRPARAAGRITPGSPSARTAAPTCVPRRGRRRHDPGCDAPGAAGRFWVAVL